MEDYVYYVIVDGLKWQIQHGLPNEIAEKLDYQGVFHTLNSAKDYARMRAEADNKGANIKIVIQESLNTEPRIEWIKS